MDMQVQCINFQIVVTCKVCSHGVTILAIIFTRGLLSIIRLCVLSYLAPIQRCPHHDDSSICFIFYDKGLQLNVLIFNDNCTVLYNNLIQKLNSETETWSECSDIRTPDDIPRKKSEFYTPKSFQIKRLF